jgi:hypothetical protein
MSVSIFLMKNDTNESRSGLLHFSTKSYPTFGRSRKPFDELNPPSTVTDSPYYWWFMFLRLNPDYRATVKNKGKGRCASLYKDFGDIYSVDFKTWWGKKASLFAEPKTKYVMKVAESASDIAPFNSSDVLNLVVPLDMSHKSLRRAFTQLVLSKVQKARPGINLEVTSAKYQLSGKWHIEALASAYSIYTLKNAVEKGEKIPLADIAIRAKLPLAMSRGVKEGQLTNNTSDTRRTLTILAKRHYKRAEGYIKAAAGKQFPSK